MATHYLSDGTGRDSYVSSDCGGTMRIPRPMIPFNSVGARNPAPIYLNRALVNVPPPMTHYICDGSGRDTYVLQRPRESKSGIFLDSLRTYENGYSTRIPDIISEQSMISHQAAFQRQMQLSERLAKPRRCASPDPRLSRGIENEEDESLRPYTEASGAKTSRRRGSNPRGLRSPTSKSSKETFISTTFNCARSRWIS